MNGVLQILSGRQEHPLSKSPYRGSIPAAPATHSCVLPGFPRDERMDRTSRLFARALSSPDSRFAEPEAEIVESLWPCRPQDGVEPLPKVASPCSALNRATMAWHGEVHEAAPVFPAIESAPRIRVKFQGFW